MLVAVPSSRHRTWVRGHPADEHIGKIIRDVCLIQSKLKPVSRVFDKTASINFYFPPLQNVEYEAVPRLGNVFVGRAYGGHKSCHTYSVRKSGKGPDMARYFAHQDTIKFAFIVILCFADPWKPSEDKRNVTRQILERSSGQRCCSFVNGCPTSKYFRGKQDYAASNDIVHQHQADPLAFGHAYFDCYLRVPVVRRCICLALIGFSMRHFNQLRTLDWRILSVGSQVLKDLKNPIARLHKVEHEIFLFWSIQPMAYLLNPDATCDPATLEKASIPVDTIAVEICQRIECRHQVLAFNAPKRIPHEHTKTAILTACGMLATTCTALWLRKSKPPMCCPIILQVQDENDAMRLLPSQALLSTTKKFRTVKVKAARIRMQRQLTKKLLPSTPPSDAPLSTSSAPMISKAIDSPIVQTTSASMNEVHRCPSTNHWPSCPTADPIPYATIPKPVAPSTASACVGAPVVPLNSQCCDYSQH
ncbi:hypothetical protein CLF_101311 [Clonorchis sinensis]|uniref:Uncharacterized protein n=1 Tax=Clonorchis sinensis TaxID=79923 RepID=G7Y5G9_CLOSI|nr:hypothetical protein CLF_101311 [Clonorchis sinensis]